MLTVPDDGRQGRIGLCIEDKPAAMSKVGMIPALRYGDTFLFLARSCFFFWLFGWHCGKMGESCAQWPY